MTDLHDDAPGRMLAGRFQLGEVLGSGGMATVWSAHDTRLGRTVAVKILHDHLSPEDASRIEREARAAARIADTRVVTVLDLDHTDDGTPFLVFEALSGRTLADELREGAHQEIVELIASSRALLDEAVPTTAAPTTTTTTPAPTPPEKEPKDKGKGHKGDDRDDKDD